MAADGIDGDLQARPGARRQGTKMSYTRGSSRQTFILLSRFTGSLPIW